MLTRCITQNLRGEDIGIIAPYVAQISLLTRLLNTNSTYRTRFEETLGSHRAMQLANIEVKTVDGFEGREKEVIIFSTVRNNAGGYIGFLADRRRLNVGLTRAKRGLFVVGSISTLKAGKMSKGTTGDDQTFMRVGKGAQAWRRYAEFLNQENMVIQLNGDRLTKLLYGNMPRRKLDLVPMKTWGE
jgi:superfamily I DNA and/or RNA helicase